MKKKMRIVTLLVALVTLLGMSMFPVAAVDLPDNAGTISGTIVDNTWDVEIGTLNFQEGKEVYMKLVVEDPYPGLDLDLEVWGPDGELIWLGGWAYYSADDPEIIEEGFFWIPQGGVHRIEMDGYWVPDENGDPGGSCDYVLYYEVGDNLIDPVAVESSGAKYGEIVSFVSNSYNAELMASDKAGFADVPDMYDDVFINVWSAMQAHAWTPYALPRLQMCAEDPLIVGGVVWTLPADWFPNYQAAKQHMGHLDFMYYIEDVQTGIVMQLSELTKTKTGSVIPNYHAGEKISYSKTLEYGVFQPGELAELIGTGQKHVWCYLTYDGEILFLNLDYYFWLMPEGTIGPR